jgi:hypothetical protein
MALLGPAAQGHGFYVPSFPGTPTNYTLAGSAGTYSISGQTATVALARPLSGSAGSYTITGQNAAVVVARKLSGLAGTYTIAGQTAVVAVARKLSGSAGSYSINGQNATVLRAVNLSGNAGVYTYAGQPANAVYTPGAGAVAYTLDGLAGNYAITGQDATAGYVKKLPLMDMHDGAWGKKKFEKYKRKEEKRRKDIERAIAALTEQPMPSLVREASVEPTGVIDADARIMAKIQQLQDFEDEELLLLL